MRNPLSAEHARRIRRIARRHGVVRLRAFGARASGSASEASDLDLLVDLKPDRDVLDLVEFKLEVERLMGREVDVVTEGGLSPYLRARILREARPL